MENKIATEVVEFALYAPYWQIYLAMFALLIILVLLIVSMFPKRKPAYNMPRGTNSQAQDTLLDRSGNNYRSEPQIEYAASTAVVKNEVENLTVAIP